MTFSRNMILLVQNVDKAGKSNKGVFKLGQIYCCSQKCSDPTVSLNPVSDAPSQQQLRQFSEKLALHWYGADLAHDYYMLIML